MGAALALFVPALAVAQAGPARRRAYREENIRPEEGVRIAPSRPAPAPRVPGSSAPPASASRKGEAPGLSPNWLPLRTVVLDPGHGGPDAGVVGGGGMVEKAITLRVAQELASRLRRELGLRVVLTRTSDVPLTPAERASIANAEEADLFLSLHADGALSPQAQGPEVFVVEPPGGLPPVGPGQDGAPGGEVALRAILWEAAQGGALAESQRLAAALAEVLGGAVGGRTIPVWSAPLVTLEGAQMPAVYVNLGYLTNPEQEARLGREGERGGLVSAIVQGLRRYAGLAASPAPPPLAPARSPAGSP
ncbi:MAG: N-acetylmuramoyl-L-alanine amidase [Nitrospinota bacterium]